MVRFWSLSENDNEKVCERYFMVIYSFKEDLEILSMTKNKRKQSRISRIKKFSQMVHVDVDLKLIYFNCCSYRGPVSPFNDFLNESECV